MKFICGYLQLILRITGSSTSIRWNIEVCTHSFTAYTNILPPDPPPPVDPPYPPSEVT